MIETGHRPAAPPGAKRVLIVEDVLLIALEMQRRLLEAGYEVVGPAARAADALRLVHEQRPDCALLDVDLNGELVTEVIDELRRLRVPLFLTTGYGLDRLPEHYRDVPCFLKPIEVQELTRTLEQMFQARNAAAESPEPQPLPNDGNDA